jgi:hypothetical protein
MHTTSLTPLHLNRPKPPPPLLDNRLDTPRRGTLSSRDSRRGMNSMTEGNESHAFGCPGQKRRRRLLTIGG